MTTRSAARARAARPTASATTSNPRLRRHRAGAGRSRARRPRRRPCPGRYVGRWRPRAASSRRRRPGAAPRRSLLRAEDLVAPKQPGQRVVDVAAPRARRRRRGPAHGREVDRRDARQDRRATRRAAGRRRSRRARRAGRRRRRCVPEPPRPTTTRRAPASIAARDQLADAARGGPLSASRRSVRCRPQAWALSTYAVSSTSSTAAGASSPYGPGTVTASSSPPERRVQHVDEARAAVRHRGQVELVAGRPPAPAVGDRRAASTAVSVPANLSGATSTRMPTILPD